MVEEGADILQNIQEEWMDVWNDSDHRKVKNCVEHVRLWYSCFARSDQIRVLRIAAEGRAVGFLPVVARRRGSCVQLLNLTNDHCFESLQVVRRGYEVVFPQLLAEELARQKKSWDILSVNYNYSFSPVSALSPSDAVLSHGWKVEHEEFPTYAISLNRPFDAYFQAALSARTRSNFTRMCRRMMSEGTFVMRPLRDAEAVEQWGEFTDIEDSGWKGRNHSSIKRLGPAYTRYYEGLIKLLAQRAVLRMFILEFNGRSIAAAFGYVDGPVFQYVKTGYREEYARYSPSFVLLLLMVQDLMRLGEGMTLFHMFPWDYGYKHRCADTAVTCRNSTLYNSSLAAVIARNLKTCRRNLRDLLDRVCFQSVVERT